MLPSRRGVLVIMAAVVLLPRPATTAQQQTETKPGQFIAGLMQWIEDHYGTTLAYQRGEIDVALERLSHRTVAEQRQIVARILGVLETQAKSNVQGSKSDLQESPGSQVDASQRRSGVPFTSPGQKPSRGDTGQAKVPLSNTGPRFDWQAEILPVAGALHMDAAFQAYRRKDASSPRDVGDQIKIAEAYFGYYERQTGKPAASPKWQLAIGLTAMADGRFGEAETVLDDACASFADDAALQLACGSVRETLAMLPADLSTEIHRARTSPPIEDNPLTDFDESTANRYRRSMNPLGEAKSVRDSYLKGAARAFESVPAADANGPEAQLRLAHVRMMQGNDKLAIRLLEPLVAREPDTPPRLAYLSRLYLAEVRARQRDTPAAATLLEQAIALYPSGRSAYLALAKVARADGKIDESAAVLHRMLRAPTDPRDPWLGYRFGQFWVPDRLIAQLRREAQQQ